MNLFFIEAQVGRLVRELHEIDEDPKVWKTDNPDMEQVLHRLICLQECAVNLLTALQEGARNEEKEAGEFLKKLEELTCSTLGKV